MGGIGNRCGCLVNFRTGHFPAFQDSTNINKVLYADLVDDYLEHGRPPGLNIGLDEPRLKRQMARYQGVEK